MTVTKDPNGVAFFFVLFLFAFAWLVTHAFNQNKSEAVIVADQQVQQTIEKQQERESNSLTVSRAVSTIVFVGDASSDYGRKWLSNEAAQCEAKGWEVKTVDLQGMSDPKFFVFAGGVWMTHNGHLSLSSLSAMVSRTTAPTTQLAAPLPSVAPRRAVP